MVETRRAPRLFAAILGALGGAVLVASPAAAHVGNSTNGFGSGFLHPITGPDHLLAMVAVGVVAATWRSDRTMWLAPAAFLLGMVSGGIAGLVGVPFPGAELLIVGSVILLGLAIAAAVTDGEGEGASWVLPLLAFAGLAHGHAHGAEAPTAANAVLYIGGFLLATACVHAAGVGIGTIVRDRRLVRASLGAATATAGVLLLVGA